MKTYEVATYGNKNTYTVSLDDERGVVGAEGLDEAALALLKYSVDRHMAQHGMSAVVALGKSVGPYSFVSDSAQ